MYLMHTICYLGSITCMIFGAYCVGKVHNMLPWCYDNVSKYTICCEHITHNSRFSLLLMSDNWFVQSVNPINQT